MLCEEPGKPGKQGGKREVELVEPGWHKGKVQFADEKPDWNKIAITLDLEDGRRCKFNIKAVHGKSVLKAIGKSGDELNPGDLVGKILDVNLDRWTNPDTNKEHNTFRDIRPTDEIPF
tara:strand:- start:311 stop:664 length:354 start_codon:yes stop_codon:yes gene_type:complete